MAYDELDFQSMFDAAAGGSGNGLNGNPESERTPMDFDSPDELLELHDSGEVIYASEYEYRQFINGNVWKDLKVMLEERLESYTKRLLNTENPREIDVEIKARIGEIQTLLEFPVQTHQILIRRIEAAIEKDIQEESDG